MSQKFLSLFAGIVICLLLVAAGCGPEGEEAVQLEVKPEKAKTAGPVAIALKLTPQKATTYKVTLDEKMSLTFEGKVSKDEQYNDKQNHNIVEMTFTQEIASEDSRGRIIADITIKKLKYFQVYKNDIILDFDSSRKQDQNHPLAKLIGQSYKIELEPTGKVARVIDVTRVRAVLKGSFPAKKSVSKLFFPEKIKDRHGTLVLPAIDKSKLQIGESWNNTKTFSFPIVGPQLRERIYTLKKIEKRNGRLIAIVEMEGIPSVELAEQLHKEQVTQDFADIFSNTETYTGRLELDVTSGKVEIYSEKLETEWVIVDPEAVERVPSALKMGAVLVYTIEKVD